MIEIAMTVAAAEECLIGIEFPFYKLKRFIGMNDADGCTTVWMDLIDWTIPKNGEEGKFYAMCICQQ